jgi:glycosyltransferase involved in cell wall biosynthesis
LFESTNEGIKVIVVSNFHEDNSISRSNIVFKYFMDRKFDTTVLYSNFSHSLRKYRYFDNEKFICLSTIGYQSSLSINRILSHFIYSLQVFKYLMKARVDIIYVILPPNWLTLTVLFKLTKNIKIIVDVLDLWPEAFPHNNITTKWVLSIISVIPKIFRGIAVKYSDYCITECDYFFEKLNLINKKRSKTVYIKKCDSIPPIIDLISKDFSIGYLGNIGHIYDFDSLIKIMLGIQKRRKVILHLIGTGPKRDWLRKHLKVKNLLFIDHGISFDENFKQNIFSKCWFGFNGYKESTEVALSYKSVDYLSYGLPLINSAKKDTNRLVITNGIGFNYNKDNLESITEELAMISPQEVITMKNNAYRTFQLKFSQKSFYNEMDTVVQNL